MQQRIRAMVANSEAIMLEAAREAAIERLDRSGWNDDEHTWEEFDGNALEPMLAVHPKLGASPVRLLDARFLIKLAERGGWLRPRQTLPDDAFIDLEQLRQLKPAFTGIRIVAVSHMWLQADHPDMRRTTLALLARALKVMVAGHETGTLAVFVDFCSLYSGTRSEQEERLYRLAVARQGDLYAHPNTWLLLVSQQPKGYPRGYSFRPGSHPNVALFDDRGWPFAECRLAGLVKAHNTQVLDLAKFDDACERWQQKRAQGWLEDENITMVLGQGLGTDLATLVEKAVARRPPPMTPAQFNAAIETKCFAARSADLGPVKLMYRRALEWVRTASVLDYRNLEWDNAAAVQVAKVLGNGQMATCKRLFLAYNQIGDEGMLALAHALETGRAPNLESIDVRGNPASGDARQSIRDTMDRLVTAGTMSGGARHQCEVFGTPEHSAKFIQKRVRRRMAFIAKANVAARRASKEAAEAAEAAALAESKRRQEEADAIANLKRPSSNRRSSQSSPNRRMLGRF